MVGEEGDVHLWKVNIMWLLTIIKVALLQELWLSYQNLVDDVMDAETASMKPNGWVMRENYKLWLDKHMWNWRNELVKPKYVSR